MPKGPDLLMLRLEALEAAAVDAALVRIMEGKVDSMLAAEGDCRRSKLMLAGAAAEAAVQPARLILEVTASAAAAAAAVKAPEAQVVLATQP